MSVRTVTTRRVVITGCGVACALGLDPETFWRRLLAGESGISRLRHLPDDTPLPVRIAGQVDDTGLAAGLAALGLTERDRSDQLALYVVGRALADAGWPADGREPLPHDLVMGTGHGTVAALNECNETFRTGGYRKLRPTTVIRLMFNRSANLASIRFRLEGPAHVVSCACASGSIALSDAFQRVRFGLAEAAVAACADTGLDLPTFAAWNRLGVLTTHPDPATASRPFDRARTGLVMGEGAAAFVLEPLETARARGARILAEVVGSGGSSDARHIVQPDPVGQVRAVRRALSDAGLEPAAIGYVNAHGTATELADIAEARTLQEVFGEGIAVLPVSNTKAQLGHLMGATAGVELVATVQAMVHGLLPPARNLDDPDPRCPLDFVRDTPRAATPLHVLKNSFAFGGTNCALILRRWTGE